MLINAYAPYGAKGIVIRVETDIRRGIPGIDITGMADTAVRESRERVRAAFRSSGLAFPLDRILVNLAPAGIRKEGAALDLPIALSILAAAGLVPGLESMPEQLMVLGELELSGRVRPVRGILAAAADGLSDGVRAFIVPRENEEEAAILLDSGGQDGETGHSKRGIRFYAVSTLEEAVHALILLSQNGAFPPRFFRRAACLEGDGSPGDFSEVRGQGRYKRALEIAAAGGHNLLVFGPPGAGKTMLARRLPSILPPLSPDEAMEVTRLHSLAGQLSPRFPLIRHPPFRSPHHSSSAEGILGGGKSIRPGEITLAHYGILFLDEAPEFRSNVLQALREPLEDRHITIVRAEGPVRLPADFQLIMAANACPCGRLGAYSGDLADKSALCFCTPEEIRRYWRKFGGALLDRIELRTATLYAPSDDGKRFSPGSAAGEESSSHIAERVRRALDIQQQRFLHSSARRNARMQPSETEKFCPLSDEAARAMSKAAERFSFSGRAYHGIIRVARTIADLEVCEKIHSDHILEAVQHRRLGEDPYDILALQA